MDVYKTNPNGAYIKVKGVDFGSLGASSLSVRVASSGGNGKLTASLGSKTGTVVATCTVASTGGQKKWATVNCLVTGAKGKNDLYWTFSGDLDLLGGALQQAIRPLCLAIVMNEIVSGGRAARDVD